MAEYGIALYGLFDVYGMVTGLAPVSTGVGFIFDPPYCPNYERFAFFGEKLGLYEFYLNPSKYDPHPQRATQVYQVIMGTNPTSDGDYVKLDVTMNWDYMPEVMWNAILPYARKKVDGSSENIYFYDATISGYNWIKVRVEGLKGEARGGYEPVHRHNVSLSLRVATV